MACFDSANDQLQVWHSYWQGELYRCSKPGSCTRFCASATGRRRRKPHSIGSAVDARITLELDAALDRARKNGNVEV